MKMKKSRHHKNGCRNNRKGFTLIELIAAIAIAAIVGTMTATMFMFPMRMLGNGEDLSNVQFNLRMTSDVITSEVRLATGVEILPASASSTIPTTIENDDKYIFVDSSNDSLVVRDKNGDRIQFRADLLDIIFTTVDPYQTIAFAISGNSGGKAFDLDSQVVALNLPADEKVIDNSGTADGVIIKIENNLPAVGTTSLYFVMSSPFEATINEPLNRYFTAYNTTGSYSYSFVNGDLPPGIGLSSGALSGTPTSVGSYIFSIRLTDTATSAVRTFLLNIVPAATSDPAPVASDVVVIGTFQNGYELTGSYTYSDMKTPIEPDDEEGASIVTWYRMDDLIGSNKSVIISYSPTSADTPTKWVLTSSEVGRYVAIEVTPKANDGRIGTPVLSEPKQVAFNAPPEALDVYITYSGSQPKTGTTLTGNYTYHDDEGDDQAITTFQWYYSDGPDKTKYLIPDATGKTFITTSDDKNKYFYFEVTPKAQTGAKVGTSIMSANIKVLP